MGQQSGRGCRACGRRGGWLALLVALALLPATPLRAAGEGTGSPWSVELRVKTLVRSHSSYEFGNPYDPYQTPLSRLEFPLDGSAWGGVALRREMGRFSLGLEVYRNVNRELEGVMKDSDWDDDAQPQLLTIYSESNCRLEPSYMVGVDADLKVSDWLGLPAWLDLRPVAGVRWQRLTFVTHDGTQYDRNGAGWDAQGLPGDSLRFEQRYWQPFLGLRAAFQLGDPFGAGPLRLRLQLDRAWVQAKNEDHHLLQAGYRLTQENTSGEAWHAEVGLELPLTPRLSATAALDYLRIRTEGTHRMLNSAFGIDQTWERGVKVWSEQRGLTLGVAWRF